jgi:hypothetical protein
MSKSTNPLEGHDVALYIDGKRISVTYQSISTAEGEEGTVEFYFETPLEAALNPDADAELIQAWGGFKPHDIVEYSVSDKYPSGGTLQIMEMLAPKPNQPSVFVCTALSDVWNHATGEQVTRAGQKVAIQSTYVRALTYSNPPA